MSILPSKLYHMLFSPSTLRMWLEINLMVEFLYDTTTCAGSQRNYIYFLFFVQYATASNGPWDVVRNHTL